ncbi:MAG: outer membrane protein assembly factor BamD [Bacteroidales bacterium]|nr:outer membrane protein assembly factor BamD [Bacteroidales bacterium]
MKKNFSFTLIIMSIMSLGGCNGYNGLLKSNDYDAKYAAAVKYFEEGSYTRATQLFENIQLYYHGKELAEDVNWYYAQCLIKQGSYYSAAYQLNNFMRRYPYSSRAEEAAFQFAHCQYLESPEYSLDQSLTHNAVDALERFSERYPQSVHIPEVNKYLDVLRGKLMRKDYEIAVGYYNIEEYRAAYVALNEFLNNYPDSPLREDAMFYALRSAYEYGANSRKDKVKERLQVAVNDFDRFYALFSDSKYIKQAQKIYSDSKAIIASIEDGTYEEK